ncbi:hypothetical protein [Bradyrhizobium liaoningense]|uniref:hypothetical protein n=1 Tax=Bradyrhizobium liaoningense TaxID=43992 RepID=UPI001BA9809F|nr:hypothetical protein [Bradyrhizobium liaoningense]MBR1170545.1 hypothetical protein [Bradyrhizobium liaoningense]
MTLARYDITVTDTQGKVVPGATVEVRLEIPGQPLAVLYSDRAGTSPIGNPLTTDGNGDAGFFCVGGFYQIAVTSGIYAKTRRYVGIGLAQGSDDVVTGLVERTFVGPGDVTITSSDADVILINKTVGAPTRAIYPLSSSTTTKKRVADRKYDAATNNITVVPSRPDPVTVTIASPAVFSKTAHGLPLNAPVSLETSGALPTGIAPDTLYYIKTTPTPDTFTVSATPGGAAINTSGSQSGTHKMGTDTIMGGAAYVIDSNGGSIELKPLADGTGWI